MAPLGRLCRRFVRVAVLALGVVLVAVPVRFAHAQTQSTETVVAPQSNLLVVAGAARYLLAKSPKHLLDAVDLDSRLALEGVLRPGGNKVFDPLWPLLAAGAVQSRHEKGDAATTLWFNPVFDCGLAIRWRKSPTGWAVEAAAPLLGEYLRGESIPERTLNGGLGWPQREKSLANGLRMAAGLSNAAARREDWTQIIDSPAEVRAAGLLIAMARVSRLTLAVRTMVKSAGYSDAIAQMGRGLGSTDPGSDVHAELSAIGPARATLHAVAALRRTDGWTAVSQSADAPGRVWLVHFTDSPSGKAAQVRAIEVVPTVGQPVAVTGTLEGKG